MAKKRKQTSDSTPNKLAKPSQPPPPVEEEFEEVEEEVEEEIEVEEEDEYGEADGGGDDDDEPISKLLEPFTKEQLMTLLSKAAVSHDDVADSIRKMADLDPVHRKIFVHGLGWDATTDTLRSAFEEYGEIEDCKSVTDKVSGKSKGYGFVLFKKRTGARNALKEPQKKIGGRMTACQLAAVGPGSGPSGKEEVGVGVSEYTQRKIYVSNVGADLDPKKVTDLFAKYGEIEEGPMGLDKQTGKFKGFCLFVYKTVEGARKALEEPHKNFDGVVLHCQRAIDGPKQGKSQHKNSQHFGGRGGSGSGSGSGNLLGQGVSGMGVPFNQGGGVVAPGLNPALGQALTALLTSQGAGLGLNNLLGALGGGGVGQVGYGSQGVGGSGIGAPSSVLGYGGTSGGGGLQGAYPNQQSGGQGGSGRSQYGHMGGGAAPYGGGH